MVCQWAPRVEQRSTAKDKLCALQFFGQLFKCLLGSWYAHVVRAYHLFRPGSRGGGRVCISLDLNGAGLTS